MQTPGTWRSWIIHEAKSMGIISLLEVASVLVWYVELLHLQMQYQITRLLLVTIQN